MAGEKGASRSVTANALQNDMANLLSDVGTASTTDRILGFDVADTAAGWAPVRFAGNDVLVMAGVTSAASLAGITAGTVTASKAVIVDASKDIASFNNITAARYIGSVETATSTYSAVTNNGYSIITATTAKTYTIPKPVAGTEKWIVSIRSSGTANVVVSATAAGATFNGTNGKATFNASAEALHLIAKSTTTWEVLENIGSVSLS